VREAEAVVHTVTNGNNDKQIKTVQCRGYKQVPNYKAPLVSAELAATEPLSAAFHQRISMVT